MSERSYQVLTKRKDGGGLEFEAVTRAQYLAYMSNDPAWRSAQDDDAPAWPERLWRRIFGRHTPP